MRMTLAVLLVAGCGGSGTKDGGAKDSGSNDAGTNDADIQAKDLASALGDSSTPGASWVVQPSGTTAALYGVAASGGGSFVAVGADTAPVIVRSVDGITWSPTSPPASLGSDGLDAVTYKKQSQSEYVAVGGGTNPAADIITSSDGVAWLKQTSNSTGALAAVLEISQGLVAVGPNQVATSADGTTWTHRTPALVTGTNVLAGLATSGAKTIVVGTVIDNQGTPSGIVYGTPDPTNNGQAWTPLYHSGPALNAATHASGGAGFVVVGDAGTIVSSTDGVAFTSVSIGSTLKLTAVTACNGTLYAVGYIDTASGPKSTVFGAPDGGPLSASSWTALIDITSSALYGVACSAGEVVVVGTNGAIATYGP